MSTGPLTVPFVDHSHLVIERGMTGATGNYYAGIHEFESMALALHFLRAGDLFVDVGANIGRYSVLAAAVRGANCLCFEPDSDARAKLVRNLSANRIDELCEVRSEAVAESVGNALCSTDWGAKNRIVDESYNGDMAEVITTTLDNALHGRSPAMCKIDVEGLEPRVLAGARRMLRCETLQLMLLEVDHAETEQLMMSEGFERVRYEPFSRSFTPDDGVPPPSFVVPRNQIWARNLPAVSERCRLSPAFSVKNVSI